MLQFEILGDPIPLARPRFSRTGTFDSQAKLKEGYGWQLKSQFRQEPLTCPIGLDIRFYMPIPKNTSGIKRRQMLAGMIQHIKRPDLDNLVKFILDCMNKIIFTDDSQIVDINCRKQYSEQPSTVIQLIQIGTLEGYHAISER